MSLYKNGKKVIKEKFIRFSSKYSTISPSIKNYLKACSTEHLSIDKKSEAGNAWDTLLLEFVDEVNCNPGTFLRMPIVSKTTHPNQQKLANEYLNEMIQDNFFIENILPWVNESPYGDPYLCLNYPYLSPLSVQHLYYIEKIRKFTNIFLGSDEVSNICEVGGGYGNFYRLLSLLGYSGNHKIIDFEEMGQVQQLYINNTVKEAARNVVMTPLGNLSCKPTQGVKGLSLLIATFSLNEMPLDTRKYVVDHLESYDLLFIAFNSFFEGVDNLSYFKELESTLSGNFDLRLEQDKYRSAWFLMGKRKKSGE